MVFIVGQILLLWCSVVLWIKYVCTTQMLLSQNPHFGIWLCNFHRGVSLKTTWGNYMHYLLFCICVFLIKVYTTQRTKCSLWSVECVFHGRRELKPHEKQIYVPLFCLFAGVSNNWTINWKTCAKQCSINFCCNKWASSHIWGEQMKMFSLAVFVQSSPFFTVDTVILVLDWILQGIYVIKITRKLCIRGKLFCLSPSACIDFSVLR